MPQRKKIPLALVALGLLAFGGVTTVTRSAAGCGPPDLGKVPPLSYAAVRAIAAQAGFVGAALDVATAIAMAESGGYPEASGDPLCGVSLGLWQINVRAHPKYKANPDALFQPLVNAQAAYDISNGGTNFAPWSTFKSGAHLAWMPGGKNYPKEVTA